MHFTKFITKFKILDVTLWNFQCRYRRDIWTKLCFRKPLLFFSLRVILIFFGTLSIAQNNLGGLQLWWSIAMEECSHGGMEWLCSAVAKFISYVHLCSAMYEYNLGIPFTDQYFYYEAGIHERFSKYQNHMRVRNICFI